MPDSACAEPAVSALCCCRTATAKVHCLNPRRVGALPLFIAPERRRAGAYRRGLAAPMWEAPGRWRKANVGARRGAPPGAARGGTGRERPDLQLYRSPANRISEDLVDLCNRGLRRLDIIADGRQRPAGLRSSGHALLSPREPTEAHGGAPPAATAPVRRAPEPRRAQRAIATSSGTTAPPRPSAADGGPREAAGTASTAERPGGARRGPT